MSEPIISISGLRGIIGDELTPLTAIRYVSAFASSIDGRRVVVGRDGRASGIMLKHAVVATLLGLGFEVLDADVIATPTLGVLIRDLDLHGGIQITASHNPPAYNGFKLFNRQGRVISAAQGERVLQAYRAAPGPWRRIDAIGKLISSHDYHAEHLEAVLRTVDSQSIATKRWRVLLDSNHGAGSVLGRRLLAALGCDFEIIGSEPNGMFAHPPEPLSENLSSIADRVRQGKFDIGFCQDPDADRLAVIDSSGRAIGEEFTSVLCAWGRLEQKLGPLVTNCASSSMMKHLADRFGVACWLAKVGEANVVAEMIERGAVYGGEGSGGPIDPQVGMVRDSFVGMAQILDLMSRHNKPLHQLVEALPSLSMIKDKASMTLTERDSSFRRLKEFYREAEINEQDGLRLDWSDRWLLVRGSNTEPIVRIIAEAETMDAARRLIEEAKQVLGQSTMASPFN